MQEKKERKKGQGADFCCHSALVLKIQLVSNQRNHDVGACLTLQLLDPRFRTCESFLLFVVFPKQNRHPMQITATEASNKVNEERRRGKDEKPDDDDPVRTGKMKRGGKKLQPL